MPKGTDWPENPFLAPGMVEGYASARPKLHAAILKRCGKALGWTRRLARGLDVGCGAGLSTLALQAAVRRVTGVEPVVSLIERARRLAPGADYAAARAEKLPVKDEAVDVVTAAGSLNYTNVGQALAEAWRVLKKGGVLVAYDFSPGRRMRGNPELAAWFEEFLRRYPRPADGAVGLDPARLRALAGKGWADAAQEEFEAAAGYSWAGYAGYMMTETNAAAALQRGTPEGEIRAWMARTLPPLFGGSHREVVFSCYFAAFRKPSSSRMRVAP